MSVVAYWVDARRGGDLFVSCQIYEYLGGVISVTGLDIKNLSLVSSSCSK